MNTISYEGVVFTRGAIRLHCAAGKIAASLLPERIMRVRIKESSFCLRALRKTLASLRMAAARSTQAHVRQPPGRPSNYLATEDPVATGDLNVEHHQVRTAILSCLKASNPFFANTTVAPRRSKNRPKYLRASS